jgi:hypothetical protein
MMTVQAAGPGRRANVCCIGGRVLLTIWAGLIGIIAVTFMAAGQRESFHWEGYAFGAGVLVLLGTCVGLAWRGGRAAGMAILAAGLAIAGLGYYRPPGGLSGSGLLEAMVLTALPPILGGALLLAGAEAQGRERG